MICIIGADGFFGTYLQQHLLSLNLTETVIVFNHNKTENPFCEEIINEEFELEDSKSIEKAAGIIKAYDDVKIIFLSAVHNPDKVKENPEKAEYLNTKCYESFLKSIEAADIKRLIYASSDTVYGESIDGHCFTENDEPKPINIYGHQKLLAEEITRKYGYSTARFSYMCGPSLTNRKKHFYDEISNKLKNGERVYMLTDWVRSALSYKTAAEITYRYLICEKDISTVNICSDTAVSKYDIGLLIAKKENADPSLVVPCTKKELGIFTEKRADTIIMNNSLSKELGFAGNTSLLF